MPENHVIKTAIVIVNFRTPELVCNCLDSLAPEWNEQLQFHVFVGDALSGDNSTHKISSHIEKKNYKWARCFDNGTNNGFASGNNIIIRRYILNNDDFKYVYFLNPDTYVRPGAVKALTEALENNPLAGVVGSKLENPDGSPRAYGFNFPAPWREFFRGACLPGAAQIIPSSNIKVENLERRKEVDWVSGASFMVRRSILDCVGLMDDQYFLYFEEVDFMRRIKKAGFQIWHEPKSRVVHIAGQSTGVRTDQTHTKPMPSHWYQSRWKFFVDSYGQPAAFFATTLFLFGTLINWLHRIIRFKGVSNPFKLWHMYFRHGFTMPPMPVERKKS